MKRREKYWLAAPLALSMAALVAAAALTGCTRGNKDKKQAEATASSAATGGVAVTVTGNTQASGKGNNRSDVPLEIGVSSFDKVFNPFAPLSEDNEKAVGLTQLSLLTMDREGAVVCKGIRGEKRYYNGEEYLYYAPAALKINYSEEKDETVYTFKLRRDLVFSDGQPVTADDLIFSMYVFCDTSYKGNITLGQEPIKGLARYRRQGGKASSNISGISRLDDRQVSVTVKGYRYSTLQALDIPICPLHVYGNIDYYDYENNQFGFPRGDISQLTKRKDMAIGAGPYRFIKYESGIVYYEANDKYYLGCPETAFIQLKEMNGAREEEKIEALVKNTVDIVSLENGNAAVENILSCNSNGKLNGGTISTRFVDGPYYTYIGINADQVCVNGRADSTRSRNLRKALATVIASGRYDMVGNYRKADKVINYPNADTSWAVPQTSDEEYKNAYSEDVDGNLIYTSHMTLEERQEASIAAALGFLKQAGYRVKNKKVIDAPENTARRFTIVLPRNAENYQDMYLLISNAEAIFEKIGLKLKMITDKNQKDVDKMLEKGKQQLWCSSAQTRPEGDLYSMYHSGLGTKKKARQENYFHIADSDLDEYIEGLGRLPGLKKSIQGYSQCFDIIMDWAVVIPVYQQRDTSIYSSSRINMETIAPDITPYYSWVDEIYNVEMK